MLIHAVSDLHGNLPVVPPGDLLLIGGDIVPLNRHTPAAARGWLDTTFRVWLDSLPVKVIVATWGNHDFIGQHPEMVPRALRWFLLVDEEITVNLKSGERVRIYGSPWQPVFLDWAFNLPEEQLAEKWERIPEGLDVLLLHGPPNGILDETAQPFHVIGQPGLQRNVGSVSLRQRLDIVQPKVTIFGHIHHSYGQREIAGLRFFNCAHVNERYQPVNPITTFTLESAGSPPRGFTPSEEGKATGSATESLSSSTS
jgi:Icc-related predicted phosphoesterase